MGTIAAVSCRGPQAAEAAAQARLTVRATFDRLERLLNAHDPTSELSQLAALSDERVVAEANEEVRACYEAAFSLAEQTGKRFNPRWRGSGTLDLGAIAKGYAVDCAAAALATNEYLRKVAWLIDLGGNLKAGGRRESAWRVGVAETDGCFDLKAGEACATSGEYARGRHIRDGRDGALFKTDLLSVTVCHPKSAMLADGLSTTLFICGQAAGENFLKTHYPEAQAIWYNIPK